MVIVWEAEFIHTQRLMHFQQFSLQRVFQIAAEYPQHTFVVLVEPEGKFLSGEATNLIFHHHQVPGIAARVLWYTFGLRKLLKQYKADVFVGGNGMCCLFGKVPQILFFDQLLFMEKGVLSKAEVLFYNIFIPSAVKKASRILAGSNWLKQAITNRFSGVEEKTRVVTSSAVEQAPTPDFDKVLLLKQEHTNGNDYFFFCGDDRNITILLKAFSEFKKWQKSSMQLVVVFSDIDNYNSAMLKCRTYKYRQEIKLLHGLAAEKIDELARAAYAAIFISYAFGSVAILTYFFQHRVPVISLETENVKELGSDALLYMPAFEPVQVAAQMKRVFKDERLRNTVIEKQWQLLNSPANKHTGEGPGTVLFEIQGQ